MFLNSGLTVTGMRRYSVVSSAIEEDCDAADQKFADETLRMSIAILKEGSSCGPEDCVLVASSLI